MHLLVVVLLAVFVVVLWKLSIEQRTRQGWRRMDAQAAIAQAESGLGMIVFNDTPTRGDWWFMPKGHWPTDTEALPESGFCWLESEDDPLIDLLPQFGFALTISNRNIRKTLESLLSASDVDDDDFG